MSRDILKTVGDVMGWFERRKAEREIEREVKIRQAKTAIRRHISGQHKMAQRLWELGKRALTLGDEAQFQRIGALYLKTQEDAARWERYLLTFEALEARRDQARAATAFLDALQAMNESLMEAAPPQAMARMQRDLAEGLARAETLEDRMSVMMELSDDALAGDWAADQAQLAELHQAMSTEAVQDEAHAYDARIEKGLRAIREEMDKER